VDFVDYVKKWRKLKKIIYDQKPEMNNSVLNLILEYSILAYLNANSVGEDRRFLDEDFQ